MLQALQAQAPDADLKLLKELVHLRSSLEGLAAQEGQHPLTPLSDFGLVHHIAPRINVHGTNAYDAVRAAYPPLLEGDGRAVAAAEKLKQVQVQVQVQVPVQQLSVKAATNEVLGGNNPNFANFVLTKKLAELSEALHQDVSLGLPVCLLGGKGVGKSALIQDLATRANKPLQTMTLFQDLTWRDLLQRRIVDADGNSTWSNTTLTNAAMQGHWLVLDGLERLSTDTLCSLARLLQDRELSLPDGQRISKIHAGFHVIALAQPPTATFLDAEVQSLFSWRAMPELSPKDMMLILRETCPGLKPRVLQQLESLVGHVNNAVKAEAVDSLTVTLRQLRRIGRQMAAAPQQTDQLLHRIVCETLIAFMPGTQDAAVLEDCLRLAGVTSPDNARGSNDLVNINTEGGLLSIGNVTMAKRNPRHIEKVPNPVFFDNPHQSLLLEELLGSLAAGEKAILLIGNQGTGKNKIADRLLHLLNCEREYTQLHRDTTVASLTSSLSIENGKLMYHDSALVQAARHGRVLLLDEADKAPLEVVCLLKNLIEDGEMALSDGRRLLSPAKAQQAASSGLVDMSQVVTIHEDFRLITLVNRPGYPFQGTDFFAHCGDCFAPHWVDNPPIDSEIQLLKNYAPDVPERDLRSLAEAFSSLRAMHEAQHLSYPYSVREAVAVSVHMQHRPNDGMVKAIENVLSFDSFNQPIRRKLVEAFQRHGIALTMKRAEEDQVSINVIAATQEEASSSVPKTGLDTPKHGREDEKNEPHVGGNTWAGGTGGSDTAGLGGRGGPYRLDKGHPVHQVSDEDKAAVTEEGRRRQRQMADEGLKQRLKDIGMGKVDYDRFKRFEERVAADSQELRVVLESVDSVSKERVWRKNQASGELDDNKLIDSALGEKLVYKNCGVTYHLSRCSRRADAEVGGKAEGPIPITFVMDCSASMYRFNGYDGRLERLLEATLMIMQALEGFGHKFRYKIQGHSGDSPDIPLCSWEDPPVNPKQQLEVLEHIVAHSQYCWSGDNTLGATKLAIEAMANEANKGNEASTGGPGGYVFVVTDANLRRYGIEPSQLGKVMLAEPSIQTYVVMIGNAKESQMTASQLPQGKGHLCLDNSELPTLFRKMLKSTVLHA
ncbi:unnamed protein product [Chrysoparadoxa australica]